MVRRRGGTPGGYDPGGGSDDGGSDTDASAGGGLDGGGGDSFTGDPSDPPDPDPEPDPEPTTPAGPGLDPGTGGGGGSDDSGGGGGGTPAGPGLDPGTGGGGSDPAPEPETTRLDQLAQRYTDTVAEPVGEAVGDTTPAAQIEQATLGTNRLERTFASAGETIAQAGNLPGIAAGARDTAQTLDQATSTAYDPVTIGGVPTGVRVPDPEGQQEVGGDAAAAGASAAASAAENPFETAGTAIGAAALGVGGSRVASQVSRRSSSSGVSTGSSSSSSGGVLDNFLDDTRAQGQIGGQRDAPDTDTVTITADDLRDQLSPQQRARGGNLPDRGADIDPEDAFQRRRDELIRGDRVVDDRGRDAAFQRSLSDNPQPIGATETATQQATGVAAQGSTASGLGALGAVNDPSGISDTRAFDGAASAGIRVAAANDPTGIVDTTAQADQQGTGVGGSGTGAGGTGVTGGLSGINDPTGITDGTTPVGDNDVTGITPSDDTGTGGDLAPVEDLRASTQVGTQERTGALAQPAFGEQTFADPTPATDITPTDGFGGGGGLGFGGGTTRTPRREQPDEESEDEPLPVALSADADEFGSGIASGDELADDLLQ